MVFSLERFNQYAFRRHVNVESEHKPLEVILQKPLTRTSAIAVYDDETSEV